MLSLALIIVAAILNAFMDTIEEGRFGNSIFSHLDPKFWYKWQSWKYARRVFNYPIDAWHLAKALMLACIMLAIVIYTPIFPLALLDFAALGGSWILTFNTFYNNIFKKP